MGFHGLIIKFHSNIRSDGLGLLFFIKPMHMTSSNLSGILEVSIDAIVRKEW